MRTPFFVLVALASVLVTPAIADSPCLMMGNIYSWNARNNKTLIVEDIQHHKFKVSLMGSCPNLPFKLHLGFQSVGGTELSCLEKGDYIIDRDFREHYRCPIMEIDPYTSEMEKVDHAQEPTHN